VRAEVAIVGNGVAGTACALRLARLGVSPLLIGPGLPVDRPPLTKKALATGEVVLLADEARLAERGVERVDAEVVEADLDACGLVLADGRDVQAGRIVLATGLVYDPPPVPGLEHAHVNATPRGLERLAPELGGGARHVLVVGAGLIGTESAATLAAAGHSVTVVDLTERPLDRLHDPLPELAAAALDRAGARFLGGVHVERAEPGRLETEDHGTLEADVVIAATGGRAVEPPGLGLAASGAGTPAGPPFEVDSRFLLPGYERVHAVGDLVAAPHARFGALRFPHWDQAIGTGEHAAEAIAGDAVPYERLPYWWSDIGELRLAEVGVAEAAAEWRVENGLHVGRDDEGVVVAVLVVDEPRRLREARNLVLEGVA
jgi:3-phenylpropionate/trans-cinnamate dioxygenase ferredoxin reductase subunit